MICIFLSKSNFEAVIVYCDTRYLVPNGYDERLMFPNCLNITSWKKVVLSLFANYFRMQNSSILLALPNHNLLYCTSEK